MQTIRLALLLAGLAVPLCLGASAAAEEAAEAVNPCGTAAEAATNPCAAKAKAEAEAEAKAKEAAALPSVSGGQQGAAEAAREAAPSDD